MLPCRAALVARRRWRGTAACRHGHDAPAARSAAPSARAAGSRPRPRPTTARPVDAPRRRSPCRGRPAGSAARSRRRARRGRARLVERERHERRRPGRPASSSWPIDTQVSVASDVGAVDGRGRVVGARRHRAAGLRRRAAAPRRRRPGPAGTPAGVPTRTCMPGGRAAEQVGVRHVVRAVAEVGQGQPGEPAAGARGRSAGRRAPGRGGTGR